jgi:hypothetical protein
MTGLKLHDSERWKHRRKPQPQPRAVSTTTLAPAAAASAPIPARTPADHARIDKWIRDRLVDWCDSCWRCRKPIIVGHAWVAVSNREVTARFHQNCHAEWRAEQEAAARQALGLDP